MEISVKAHVDKATKMLNIVERSVIPKATVNALNKTANSTKGKAVKAIAAPTGLKQKYISGKLDVTRASKSRLVARVSARKGAPNIIEWVNKRSQKLGRPGKRTKRFRDGGVTAKAWGKTKVYRGSFVGSGRSSGKPLVYVRQGKGGKLKALRGPSIPRTFIEATVLKVMTGHATTFFVKRFDESVRYYLSRL